MSHSLLKGIGIGLLAASVVTLMNKPAPVLEIKAPRVHAESIVYKDIYYNQFSPMPEVHISTEHGEDVLHHAVRRVKMDDGESGLRLVMWVKGQVSTPEFI
jgi:hypothetical protein